MLGQTLIICCTSMTICGTCFSKPQLQKTILWTTYVPSRRKKHYNVMSVQYTTKKQGWVPMGGTTRLCGGVSNSMLHNLRSIVLCMNGEIVLLASRTKVHHPL